MKVDARVTGPSLVKRCVSFVVMWLPGLYGAAVAVVLILLFWPLTAMSGFWGLVGVTQVVWLSAAWVGLLLRVPVTELMWAIRNHRVRAEQAAARQRQAAADEDQADTDTDSAEEVAA